MIRSKPWEIAADLETAARAVASVRLAIAAVHESAWPEINALPGIEAFDHDLDKALQALSDKYQAIADAEPEA